VTATTTERTLILVKPDGVARGLVGTVLHRVEAKGYRLVTLDLLVPGIDLLAAHYAEHVDRPFYQPLITFMSSGMVAAAVAEGDRVVEGFRSLAGATEPTAAAPGTIRGDFGREWGAPVMQNIVHGSDSVQAAEREIALWFSKL
jgi:nucleoside-diphosphate kinase